MTDHISQMDNNALAAELEDGAQADIFYDAHDFGDDTASNQIDDFTSAAMEAAERLRRRTLTEDETKLLGNVIMQYCEDCDQDPTVAADLDTIYKKVTA